MLQPAFTAIAARRLAVAYGLSLAALVAVVAIRWLLDPVLSDELPLVTLFGAVAFAVWLGGFLTAALVVVLGYLACNYLFINPRGQFTYSEGDVVGILAYLATCTLIIAFGKAMRSAQRRARDRAETLRTTFASIGDAVITTDAHGFVTYLNPIAESLTGWAQADAHGKPLARVFKIINEQSRQTVEDPVAKVLKLGQVSGLANHTLLIRPDGVEQPIDDSAAPIRNSSGQIVGVILVFHDITERRKTERAVRQSEARKAAILETALDCIITIDHQGGIVEFNPAAERTFGYRKADVLGRKMADLIVPPAFREQHHQGFSRYLATGEGPILNRRIEMPALHADGTEIPVELTVTAILQEGPPLFTAYLRDISESIQIEKRRAVRLEVTQILAEASTVREAVPRILRSVCENLSWDVGAMWQPDLEVNELRCFEIWHSPTVQIAEFEAATLQHTFAPGLGLPGRIWNSRQPAWIPDVVKDANFPRAPIAHREGLHAAFGFPIVIGSEFLGVIEFFSQEIREPDTDLLEMMTTIGSQVGNFIERKRAEETLLEADRRKDQFLATLAHELRGPLAPIRNMLEILKRADDDSKLRQEARETIERQLSQLVRLVDDLLDVSRITRDMLELRTEPTELASVIHHAIETCRPLVDQFQHELVVTLPSEQIFLKADPVRLAQIFSNLVNNSCKYTDLGGKIWLTAKCQGNEVTVSVRDNGAGIPPDKLGVVFHTFAQVDSSLERSHGGLGLGLTLVKRLVEMHGGTVEAKSDGLGKGSQFVVRLPVLIEPPAKIKEPSPVRLPISGGRFLIVDDNLDTANSLALLLRMTSNEAVTAHDGHEAVEVAEKLQPDVMLLDIGLPKMNGFDVCRAIRQKPWGQDLVIIALTGWGQEEDRRKSKEAGFDGHLVKPVDYGNLTSLLAELQDRIITSP